MKKVRNALLIPDTHVPFEDKKAYELMLAVAVDVGLDEIVIMGDFADFYDVMSHQKDPRIRCKLEFELIRVQERLMELNALFPNTKKVYICGNHENRLDRYIANNAPALFGRVSIESLLGLKELGYEFVDYGPNQKYKVLGSKLYARHEPIGGGEHSAASTVKKANKSVAFGHTHRIQEFQFRDMDGDMHRGINLGCLVDMNHPVFNYVKSHVQWCHGFGIVNVLEDGSFFNHIVHIIDYKCTYNGFVYQV